MSLLWCCDRCSATSNNFTSLDDPPEGWRQLDAPVRGSQGARSTRPVVICTECDDALYDWFTYDESGDRRKP